MAWVQYDAQNNIRGVCANRQFGQYVERLLPDNDPAVVAFLNPPPDARVVAMTADANRAALLAKLKSSTPAQIDSYVTANVTTLVQARDMIGNILKLLALDARQ